MNEKINFRNVAQVVRFELLGSLNMPTPSNFETLSDEEKAQIYEKLFDLHHDVCCYLSSALYLDELATKYEEINARNESINDAADE